MAILQNGHHGEPVLSFVKAIVVVILFLILAVLMTLGLTIGLLAINFPSDPMLLVTTSFVGLWLLLCSFYFKGKEIRWGALALLGFSCVGLVVIGA